MRVAFATLGCKVNQAESAAMEGLLTGSGAEVVPFEEKADFYIINTCSVTGKSDYQSRQLVRRASRNGGQVIATGCYAELKQEELKKTAIVALFISNQEKQNIVQFIKTLSCNFTLKEPLSESSCCGPSRFFYSSSRSRAFLKVQDGCDSYCAYCIVPFARGRSQSLPIKEAAEAFNSLAEQGYKEVVFTGIHTGRYGREQDNASTLFNLVHKASQAQPDIRIRLSSIEAEELDPAFIKMMQNGRLCQHLHIPLQSGSDEVLKSMNRKASVADFKELVLTAAKEVPGIAIGTDVIAGLPGETEKDFQMTYELLEALPVSYFHVFPYSPRPGTLAERMKNQVPVKVRKKRAELLRQLSEKKRMAFTASFYGKVLDVIVQDSNDSQYLKGLSHNYLKVFLRVNGLKPEGVQRVKVRFVDIVGGYPLCVGV